MLDAVAVLVCQYGSRAEMIGMVIFKCQVVLGIERENKPLPRHMGKERADGQEE